MQNEYFAFITAAYAISALSLLGLGLWIALDARARRSELKALEARGIRRRSDRHTKQGRPA
ncbi:heme exporter protein CcmD [Consotaella aegiceratis]|uniref:heme exporter protein CcmD n=1 Tax=Consotaella aegiceratis TaxID=3097961 RepID=UPI002F40D26A